jgi:hypothetical protein
VLLRLFLSSGGKVFTTIDTAPFAMCVKVMHPLLGHV